MRRLLVIALCVFISSCSLSEVESTNLTAKGMEYFQAGKTSKAESSFKEALEKNPKNDKAAYRLGILALRVNNYDDAEKYMQKAAEINPEISEYWYQLGSAQQGQAELLLEQKDVNGARSRYSASNVSLKKAVEVDPFFAEAFLRMARNFIGISDMSAAAEMYMKSIHANPTLKSDGLLATAVAYKELGMLYADYGFNNEAALVLLNGIANNPEDSQLEGELGNLFLELRKYEEALQHFKRSYQLFEEGKGGGVDMILPTIYGIAIANSQLGEAAMDANNIKAAIDYLTESKKWFDNFSSNATGSEFLGQRGVAQARATDIREILKELEKGNIPELR